MEEGIRSIEIGDKVPVDAPAVSVMIPCYKTAEFVAETLDSVFSQTFTDFEVILVNDDSPDVVELRKATAPYLQSITFIDKSRNSGLGDSRNVAATRARGKFFVFLDSDDAWHPEYLKTATDFLRDGGFDMVYTAAECFGLPHWPTGNNQTFNPEEGEITRQMYIAGKCHILPSGALMTAEAFHRVDGFDPHLKCSEDFHFFMRLLFAGGRIGYIKQNLLRYRIRVGSLTGNAIDRLASHRDVWVELMKILPFTADEVSIIERHIAQADAAILRAEGRYALLQSDWPTAIEKFRGASSRSSAAGLPFRHRAQMLAILAMLRLYPQLVRSAMMRFRRSEILHMPDPN